MMQPLLPPLHHLPLSLQLPLRLTSLFSGLLGWLFPLPQMPQLPLPWPPHPQPLPLFLPPPQLQQLLPLLPLGVPWVLPQPWLRPLLPP